MSAYSTSVDVAATASYPTTAQVIIPFEPKRITVVVEESDAGEGAHVSFDGANDAGVLIQGMPSQGLVFDQRVTKVWLKRFAAGAGTITVRVMAES
jgi:hypothetical protein